MFDSRQAGFRLKKILSPTKHPHPSEHHIFFIICNARPFFYREGGKHQFKNCFYLLFICCSLHALLVVYWIQHISPSLSPRKANFFLIKILKDLRSWSQREIPLRFSDFDRFKFLDRWNLAFLGRESIFSKCMFRFLWLAQIVWKLIIIYFLFSEATDPLKHLPRLSKGVKN